MSSSLYRLGRLMASLRWKVVAAWGIILLAVGGLAIGLGGSFSTSFEIPGTEAQDGLDNLAHRFPEMGGTAGQVVFVTEDGQTVDDHQQAIEDTMAEIGEVEGVAAAPSPFDDLSPGTRADDDGAIIAQFQMDGQIGEYPESSVEEITALVESADSGALDTNLGGQVLSSAAVPFSIGEILGVVAALIILAILFRAILPSIVPIVTAIVGVAISMLAVLALAAGIEIPSVTITLGAMLGLAVGIDYALFILSRHRDQLTDGEETHESIGQAIATSGSAVIFAGLAVITALVGLFVTGIPFVTTMGVAAAGAVALAVVVAVTLLPAFMSILGERLRPKRVRRLMADNDGRLPEEAMAQRAARKPFGTRWVRLATKIPVLTIVLVALGAGALAIPSQDLRLALPDQGTEQEGTQARETYDLIAEEFGPGYNGPLLVTADIINTTDPLGVVEDLESEIASLDDVREIQLATPNQGADLAVIAVIPEEGPTAQSTLDLVDQLRANADGWEQEHGISEVTVTGSAAVGIDVTDQLSDALVPFAVFVVGLSLILLLLVFRSIWVPITASLGFLISVGVAFGVTALVFEHGWLNEALFVHVNGPVVAFMPIMVMGVLFGLAMDYQMFLVTRMREEYVRTGDPQGAIERGFTAGAPVVIAAALIMVSVFAGFITSGWFMLQPIAIGLAVGVLVDAFVVRMTLVPAVLALLGRHAWWLPGWLDRSLPRVDSEGEGLHAVLEHRDWTERHGVHALRLEHLVVPLTGDRDHQLGPLTGAIAPGTALVVRSPDDAVRETFLALAGGRLEPSAGIFAVHDRLAPDDLGAIQSRVHWVSARTDVADRLREISGSDVGRAVIVIEQLEDLAHASTVDDMFVERLDELLEKGATLIVGSRSPDPTSAEHRLTGAMRAPQRLTALSVQRSTASAPEGALV